MMNHKAIDSMLAYFRNESYISHALRVYGYATGIGAGEGLSERDFEILQIASLYHDVGIPEGLRLEGSGAGPVQERLGAPIAMELARPFLPDEEAVAQVGELVAHHHSFHYQGGPLLQMLFEADWLVNLADEGMSDEKRRRVYELYFKTATGRAYFSYVYPSALEA